LDAVRIVALDASSAGSMGTTQRSVLVEHASSFSRLLTKQSSFPSGEIANPRPPSENAGLSQGPGVRSFTTFPLSASTSRMCVRVPSRQAVQCR
jgi:hypothetical protein